jgi:hypothetical protein
MQIRPDGPWSGWTALRQGIEANKRNFVTRRRGKMIGRG